VVESLPLDDVSPQKRRSTRIVQAVPITVAGVDALGQPFKERTTTVMVNCHGCKYQSKHYVPKNSTIKLEIPHPNPSLQARSVLGRVVWVQRPRAVRELFQIGLEFEVAGNIWGITFPPEDWFPLPGEEAPTAASPAEFAVAPEPKPSLSPATNPPQTIAAPAAQATSPVRPDTMPSAETRVHVMPVPSQAPASSPSPEAQLASARQMAKMVEDAKETLDKTLKRGAQSAINDEMTIVRQQLDVQLHEAVERAIKVSMERVSESAVKKVVQQAADRTTAIVEEARRASDTNAENLDAKVRQAVEQAVSNVADQAAQQAAQHAAAHNLKNAVEEAVERVISQREASTPSLGILSSPEAAQQHLNQWKKGLEEAAQSVRARTIDDAQADAGAAKLRWKEEFEAAVNGASQNLGQKLSEASQAALAQAEQDLAERQSRVRASLDEAVTSAQSTIQSLGSGLEQERARAETAKAELGQKLGEISQAALAQTERDLAERQSRVRASLDEAVASARATIQSLGSGLEQERARTETAKAELGQKLGEISQAALARTERDLAERQSGVRASLDSAVASAQSTIQSLGSGLEQERARAEMARVQLEEAARSTLDETRRNLDDIAAAQHQEAVRRADQAIAERAQQIEPLLRSSAQQIHERLAGELDQTLAPKIAEAQKAASGLTAAGEQAARLQSSIREQVHHASEQAAEIEAMVREHARRAAEQASQIQSTTREHVQRESQQAVEESLDRLRKESAKIPDELERTVRATLSKVEEEFEQKSIGAQHETYEALSKASDWYQKKAQTTMQSALEKAVEQSTSALRGRAAEISSLVASELDHYRRSYVQHSQAEIEEAAKDIVDRERTKLGENAEIAHAGFSDRIQQVSGESLRRLEESSRQALEKARSDMEYTRDGSLTAFQEKIEEKMLQSVDQAQVHLQSQIGPMIEALEANRQKQNQEWLEQLKKSTNESIEQYKTRLENASNSWLLASATTLGQHSQTVLDTLAKAAEKRMRESIAGVLAGMGDTLKERLMGISENMSAEDNDDNESPAAKL
jgi:hypothetical protein